MADKSVWVKLKRQDSPASQPYWEEFELRWRPGMNVIIALMDIALNPVNLQGKQIAPIVYDSKLSGRSLWLLRDAHQRSSGDGVLVAH